MLAGVLPPRLALRLFVAVLLLTALGVLAALVEMDLARIPAGHVLLNLFGLNRENTVPAWFSSALLLSVAGLGLLAGRLQTPHATRFRRLWRLFAAVFVLLSLDESAALHERLESALDEHGLQLSGPLTFVWVVPALAFVAVMSVLYLRFLLQLARPVGLRLALAAALYVGGAAGMEMLDGAVYSLLGKGPAYVSLTVLEEFLEMCGLVVCVSALVLLLKTGEPALFARTEDADRASRHPPPGRAAA